MGDGRRHEAKKKVRRERKIFVKGKELHDAVGLGGDTRWGMDVRYRRV